MSVVWGAAARGNMQHMMRAEVELLVKNADDAEETGRNVKRSTMMKSGNSSAGSLQVLITIERNFYGKKCQKGLPIYC
ncbi:hypothetical protein GOP47_0003965 [Adiantum capillus-veneris]|uniref:Uncharacterized protein n=1 Tax=Adiantum capillus-veneris TaxID=13818 RepID=A0A9D4ZP29_ADICA|nr:hypothetical protein GOP47_0003965 [Adiantum capillus-veneris]